MKTMKKLLVLLVACSMVMGCLFSVACVEEKVHECGHICTVCGKCTDTDCKDPVCKDKCAGHTNPPPEEHECEHVCPEAGCGKCLDKDCKDPVCANKCPGHQSEEKHECKHVCPEAGCGKCLDKDCKDPVCANKCPGHQSEEKHECKDKCPTCQKCTTECTESECEEKCPKNHEGETDDEYTVTFVTTNGDFTGTIDGESTAKTVAGKLASLPTVTPDGEHVKFIGWYTTATDDEETGDQVTTEYEFTGEEKAVSIYARYQQEYVITLNVGEGTLSPADAKTTYITVDGKINETLPEATSSKAHWHFMNWYDGDNEIDEDTTVFTKDTELVAVYGRDNGLWSGENLDVWKSGLSKNTGASGAGLIAEYWLGGGSVKVEVGDKLGVSMNGKLIDHYLWQPVGVEPHKSTGKNDYVTVTVAGDLKVYVKLYESATDPDNWTVEWAGATKVETGSEVPVGCDAINVTWGTNKITFYLKDTTGAPVGKDRFSEFCIYTFNSELFGAWATSTTKGVLAENMTSTVTSSVEGWIFRWGSGFGQQTKNITGLKSGSTYLVELKGHQVDATITELKLPD